MLAGLQKPKLVPLYTSVTYELSMAVGMSH